MKIAFIDIDGVLNYHNCKSRLADSCLEQARRIGRETSSKFVLTSDWRESVLFPESCHENDIKFVDNLMHNMGLDFVGVTPYINYKRRGLEIKTWLEQTELQITQFVILDDLNLQIKPYFPNNFVLTSGFAKQGLTKENADQAIKILNS